MSSEIGSTPRLGGLGGLGGAGSFDKNATEPETGLSRGALMAAFWAAAALSIALPRIPYGRNILYPFSLLGVWAHEMGHGLTALLTGGGFEKLELYRGLGGVAYHTGAGRFTGAMVSAGGLMGPAIFGGLIIIFGSRSKTAKWVLAVLSVLILVSVALWIRNAFGFGAMLAMGVVLAPIAFYAPPVARILLAQFIGIQFVLSSWGTLDYMFTNDIVIDGKTVPGDSGAIEDALFLPYWFWGGLTAFLSAVILLASFWFAWIRPRRVDPALAPN